MSRYKSETRNPKPERNPNSEGRNIGGKYEVRTVDFQLLFGFRISDFFRVSDFGFRISLTSL